MQKTTLFRRHVRKRIFGTARVPVRGLHTFHTIQIVVTSRQSCPGRFTAYHMQKPAIFRRPLRTRIFSTMRVRV